MQGLRFFHELLVVDKMSALNEGVTVFEEHKSDVKPR